MNMNRTQVAATGITLLLMIGFVFSVAPVARAAGPCGETAYANGQEFCINLTKVITNPSPGLLKTAEPIYIAAYFATSTPTTSVGDYTFPTSQIYSGCDITDQSTCGQASLPSGYQPLCNPCFHGDLLNSFPYHDHVLSGAPGFGNQGTAGVMKGPWVIIIVAYDPSYSNQAGFTPFKSMSTLQGGEQAGQFLSINPSATNPYEINTGLVAIFGVQPLN